MVPIKARAVDKVGTLTLHKSALSSDPPHLSQLNTKIVMAKNAVLCPAFIYSLWSRGQHDIEASASFDFHNAA